MNVCLTDKHVSFHYFPNTLSSFVTCMTWIIKFYLIRFAICQWHRNLKNQLYRIHKCLYHYSICFLLFSFVLHWFIFLICLLCFFVCFHYSSYIFKNTTVQISRNKCIRIYAISKVINHNIPFNNKPTLYINIINHEGDRYICQWKGNSYFSEWTFGCKLLILWLIYIVTTSI